MTDNMELWNSVCETDPSTTKEVSQKGGFTAICAQAQFKRATELWGPYGGKWGIKDCEYGYIQGGETNEVSEVWVEALFYYPSGEFAISSDIAFRVGNDNRKKLLTDITTKSLSKLGFNADVFEGKFDDNKYIERMKEKHKPKDTPERIWLKESVVKLNGFKSRKEIMDWNLGKETVNNVSKLNEKQKDHMLGVMQKCLAKFDTQQTNGKED